MSILKVHGIKRTRENIAALERMVRLVPVREPRIPDVVYDRLEQLGKAMISADVTFEELLGVRFVDDNPGFDLQPYEPLPITAIEALHAFYCEQAGTPDASMSRHSARDARGKKQDAPALRFVTECLQTRNPKITISAVEKAWRGRKLKPKKAV
ncbi:MAG: hypothetical protein C0519_15820 [Hyphomicrobium sp.]|nr:hypothetical protein [Hyphomicrobium sp.]PPD05923.1 MAG: hypothetical protein CTY28_15620 [Hyphomicrobium sp.]